MKLSHIASVALGLALVACSSSNTMSWRTVEFGSAEDVLGDTASVLELTGPLPQSFLVGGAKDVTALLQERTRLLASYPSLTFTSIMDVSKLDEAAALAASDAALSEALETDGLVLIDHDGATTRALADNQPGLWLIRVNADGEVTQNVALPGSKTTETIALGGSAAE